MLPQLGTLHFTLHVYLRLAIQPSAVAPSATAQARTRIRARRRSWTRATPFSGQGVRAWWKGLVIMHGLVAFFLELIHPSSHTTFHSCSICLCDKSYCGINCLDDDCQVICHCNRVGCFNGSRNSCNDAASISNHSCMQQEDEQSLNCFFSLILSRTPATLIAAWHCSKKAISWSKSVGTVLFLSANLYWCALGCAKKICSLFSCAVGNSIVQWM